VKTEHDIRTDASNITSNPKVSKNKAEFKRITRKKTDIKPVITCKNKKTKKKAE